MVDNNKDVQKIFGKLKTYLIGSMEATGAGDEGKGWRDYLRPKLEERNIHVFDPTIGEEQRTGMPSKEFHDKLSGLVASGHWKEFEELMNKVWKGTTYTKQKEDGTDEMVHIMGDKDYVEHADFITCRVEKGDNPCGTYGEAYQAWLFNKPIYLITECPKKELSKSFLYWLISSGGEVFPNFSQFLEYIDEKYKDKIAKPKKKEDKK